MAFHRIRHARASFPSSIPSILAAWLCTRRVFFASRFAFAVAAASVFGSKVVHVYAHCEALASSDVLAYGLSFFTQDVLLLLVLRLLLDAQSCLAVRPLRLLAASLASAIVAFSLLLAATSISFFLVAGTELHWRNIGVAGDSSSWAMLLSGLFSCSLTVGSILVTAWVLQDLCFVMTNAAFAIIQWPFSFVLGKLSRRWRSRRNVSYQHVPQDDVEGGASEHKMIDDVSCQLPDQAAHAPLAQSKWFTWLHVAVGVSLLTLIVTTLSRPNDSSLVFMSWTLPLMPLVDFINASPSLANLIPSYGTDINGDFGNRTALADPVPFPWLPKDTPLPGFEDWYEKREHYRAANDPLRVSNLDHGVISEIKNKLSDVKIRHVVLIKLESTRKDVFPIKRSGTIWDELIGTFKNKSMPAEALERLSTLTPTANMLTGDYDDGFKHQTRRRRGGINANNAHTTSTYTLKSLFGTMCGLYPLVADFNVEQEHHVYQPCLPHIFNAFNHLKDKRPKDDKANDDDDFTSYKWTSKFMQSVTIGYDKQEAEMPVLGYAAENVIHKEYLQGDNAKFGKVNISDINYYGMPEVAIKDYIRDAFASAKKNKERVFLSHLTSTTHHPFGMPEEEKYIPLTAEKKLNDLSHYLNAVGYVDRWLNQILSILDEEGVADETLLVLVGDHGLSLPETGAVTPYYNGNIGNFHVPLVLSHPKLPSIDINDAVVSLQILPTILDLLIETGSLPESASRAAHDLIHNYEGQSLIRPQRKVSLETGEANWFYTVMNPGRANVAIRDARQLDWRLIMPVIDDVEWRFTNTAQDPRESDAVVAFTFASFLEKVEKKHGIEAARWTERAAFMGRWWVKDNGRRWRFAAR